MADRDTEIAQLKAQIAALEARPGGADLEWLKNSNVWKRAELAASPRWLKANVIFVSIIWGGFIVDFLYVVYRRLHGQ